jgi:hypothetical protein
MWTIVLSVGGLFAAAKCFGPDFIPSWLLKLAPDLEVIGVIGFIAIVLFFSGKSAARAVRQQQTSARKFFVFLLIGIGCSQLAEVFPLLGLGGLFAIYGLIGLLLIGFKKISERKSHLPINSESKSNKVS